MLEYGRWDDDGVWHPPEGGSADHEPDSQAEMMMSASASTTAWRVRGKVDFHTWPPSARVLHFVGGERAAPESEAARERRLAEEQDTLDLWHWADGSPISGRTHVMYTFGLMPDHFKMNLSTTCEAFCHEARILLFMPMGDSGENLRFMQGYVLDGTEALVEGVVLRDGTRLRLRLRFQKGDAPIHQKMRAVTGGNANWRCWLCPVHINEFVSLVKSREGVELRDERRAIELGKRCACIEGCERGIHVREMSVRPLRRLAYTLCISSDGTQAEVEMRVLRKLKGSMGAPIFYAGRELTDLSVASLCESAPDFRLHVLKGLLSELRTEYKKALPKSERILFNTQEREVIGAKEAYSGSDLRLWLAAFDTINHGVMRTGRGVRLFSAIAHLAQATRWGFSLGYRAWWTEQPKATLRFAAHMFMYAVDLRAAVPPLKTKRGGIEGEGGRHQLYQLFHHMAGVHACEYLQMVPLLSIDTEASERMFGPARAMTNATSNQHSQNVVENIVVRTQLERTMKEEHATQGLHAQQRTHDTDVWRSYNSWHGEHDRARISIERRYWADEEAPALMRTLAPWLCERAWWSVAGAGEQRTLMLHVAHDDPSPARPERLHFSTARLPDVRRRSDEAYRSLFSMALTPSEKEIILSGRNVPPTASPDDEDGDDDDGSGGEDAGGGGGHDDGSSSDDSDEGSEDGAREGGEGEGGEGGERAGGSLGGATDGSGAAGVGGGGEGGDGGGDDGDDVGWDDEEPTHAEQQPPHEERQPVRDSVWHEYLGERWGEQAHGHGVEHERFSDGREQIAAGRFVKGCLDGPAVGIDRNAEGDVYKYKGQFKNGLLHGMGEFIGPNGDMYRGAFEDGMPSGVGQRWCDDSTHGIGIFTQDEGGNWAREALSGELKLCTQEVETAMLNADRAADRAHECAKFDRERQEFRNAQQQRKPTAPQSKPTAPTEAAPEPKEVRTFRQALSAPSSASKLGLVDELARLLNAPSDNDAHVTTARNRVLYAVGKVHKASKALMQQHEGIGGTATKASEHVAEEQLDATYATHLVQLIAFSGAHLSMPRFLARVAQLHDASVSISTDDARIASVLSYASVRRDVPEGLKDRVAARRRGGAAQVEAARLEDDADMDSEHALRTRRSKLIRAKRKIEDEVSSIDSKLQKFSGEENVSMQGSQARGSTSRADASERRGLGTGDADTGTRMHMFKRKAHGVEPGTYLADQSD